MRRNPTFTAVAAGTLALAIGVNVVMFSVLNTVLFRPLPFQAPDELVMLWTETPSQDLRENRSAFWNIEEWRRRSRSFSDVAAFDERGADADARRRDATGSRRQGVAEPVSVARRAAAVRTELRGRRGGGAASSRGQPDRRCCSPWPWPRATCPRAAPCGSSPSSRCGRTDGARASPRRVAVCTTWQHGRTGLERGRPAAIFRRRVTIGMRCVSRTLPAPRIRRDPPSFGLSLSGACRR